LSPHRHSDSNRHETAARMSKYARAMDPNVSEEVYID
jgi:hypothetical protein